MKRIIMLLFLTLVLGGMLVAYAQQQDVQETTEMAEGADAVDASSADSDMDAFPADSAMDAFVADSAMAAIEAELEGMDAEGDEEGGGLHKQLKRKFIEGSTSFMSLVALALVLGLAFCIERLIYLTLSEINAKRLMQDIDAKLEKNDVEGAKTLCRNTRGPVASICYQGLLHIKEPLEQIDRQLTNYGTVQVSNMEKGCSWIRMFIAVAPSLGFLGTVIGMVMAFDRIQTAGDISPTIVAEGMKVALITTIFGIIVAIILQFFYNYILSKIERLTLHMEESAITLMDSITNYQSRNNG